MFFYGMERFGLDSATSIMDPADLGLVNGQLSLNGWFSDIAAVKGLYAPPVFSDNFMLNIRFNGRRIAAAEYIWHPMELVRNGACGPFRCSSRLTLAGKGRAAMLEINVENTSACPEELTVQYEIDGGVDSAVHWPFNRPSGAAQVLPLMEADGQINMDNGELRVAVASSLELSVSVAGGGTFDAAAITLCPGEKLTFNTFIAIDIRTAADCSIAGMRCSPENFRSNACAVWRERVEELDRKMPHLSAGNKTLCRLYDRSLLHLLLNEWRVEGYPLQPYYSTGGINGGCFCCYLWNYGEPYRLWSMIDPEAAKAHLRAYLHLDLTDCYAFYPGDLAAYGPYYPVNQEKILFLAHAYVFQTGDKDFLFEDIDGKKIWERLLEEALRHDDLSKDAVLVDYGPANNHLELRKEFHYNGIMPDLNLRRCVNFRLMDELCIAADIDIGIDLKKRAEALKKLIHSKLFDPELGWFMGIHPDGREYISWTIQMFKALGWEDWALTEESSAALAGRLEKDGFIGEYGIHSLAKYDPAYDRNDVDNGGPGACISFAPAIADRLYRCGRSDLGWKLFSRLLWLADAMPYWGDSQYAAMMEYRRDTPLQGDIQGAALAQTVIFSIFGIKVNVDGSIEVSPVLPEGEVFMKLENIRLAGKVFAVEADNSGFTVACNGICIKGQYGEKITVP